MAVFQQTFLGASVTNFNVNLGLNSNVGSLSVNLVADNENKRIGRDVNAIKEGYGWDSTDSTKLFPSELWGEINDNLGGGINSLDAFQANIYKTGDYFSPPPVGSPVFFAYFDDKNWYDFKDYEGSDIEGTGSFNLQYLRDRWDASILSFGGILNSVKKQFSESTGITFSADIVDPRIILEGTQIILSDTIALTAPPDQDMGVFYDVHGVQRKLNRGFAGAYNVLNPYGYYELRYDPTNSTYPVEFPFSYNRLDYSGSNQSGMPWMQDIDPSRPPPGWQSEIRSVYDYIHLPGIQWALESMMGGWNKSYYYKGEPFGGTLFYGVANSLQYKNTPGILAGGLPDAPFNADATGDVGTHAYRYIVDMTELRKLHAIHNPSYLTDSLDFYGNREMYWGGTIPNDFRIEGQSMSLLQLIQSICEAAGADFFISLLPGCFYSSIRPTKNTLYTGGEYAKTDAGGMYYSGVIKVNVIQRNRPANLGVISKAIHDATENHKGPWAADSVDCLALNKVKCKGIDGSRLRCEWNKHIKTCESIGGVTNADVGREFTNVKTNIMMFGAAKTRMVGVTTIGAAKHRKEVFIDQDNSRWNICVHLSKTSCDTNASCTWDDYQKTCTGFGETDPYFIEYLPNTELDGATLQGHPADTGLDSAYGINNDEYVNWQWHRHAVPEVGGTNTSGDFLHQHDRFALNSVSSIGAGVGYECSLSYPHSDRTVKTDKVDLASSSACTVASDSSPMGSCGTMACIFNKCVRDNGDVTYVTNILECALIGGEFTKDYVQAVESAEECAGLAEAGSQFTIKDTYRPYTYFLPVTGGVSETVCKAADGTPVHIPYHWNVGDGFIDLYPMWGYDQKTGIVDKGSCSTGAHFTEEDCLANNGTWNNPNGLVVSSSQGQPILGLFNDDDPYRDFDEGDGIYSIISYYNPQAGYCWDKGPSASCPACEESPSADTEWATTTSGDIARCMDQSSTSETKWVSWCSNQDNLGRREGDPFSASRIYYEKIHLHHCMACTVGNHPTQAVCEDANGEWVSLFREIGTDQRERRTAATCLDMGKNGSADKLDFAKIGHWEPMFLDEDKELEPKFGIFKYSKENRFAGVMGVGNGASCIFRNDPDPDNGFSAMALDMGNCEWPWIAKPATCQGEIDIPSEGIEEEGGVPEFEKVWISKAHREDVATSESSSWWYRRPATATIPIDLGDVGFRHGGPSPPRGTPSFLRLDFDVMVDDFPEDGPWYGDYYYATVTELRHAAVSFDSWKNYLRYFDPFLPCDMGWSFCPDSSANVKESKGAGNVFGQIFGLAGTPAAEDATTPKDMHTAAWNEDEKKKLKEQQAYEIIANIAQNHYGKTYLMPLPMTPMATTRCVDSQFDNQEDCEADGWEWGTHGFPNVWVRKLDERGLAREDRWEISSHAWVGDDTSLDFMSDYPHIRRQTLERHVRYPQHSNFWTTDGNCEPFVVYPRQENKRLEKINVDVDFTQADPESLFMMPPFVAGNLGGKTQGKTFMMASVDPKIHWLPTWSTWEEQHWLEYWGCKFDGVPDTRYGCETSCEKHGGSWQTKQQRGGFFQPYALITVAAPASYSENDTLEIETDFQGCWHPKAKKIGPEKFIGKVAAGLCLDPRHDEADIPPMDRDPGVNMLITDVSFQEEFQYLIHEGYGCTSSQASYKQLINVVGDDGVLEARISYKRIFDKYGHPVQTKEGCDAQPVRNVTIGAAQVAIDPEWMPKEICEEMTVPAFADGGVYTDIANDEEACENTALIEEFGFGDVLEDRVVYLTSDYFTWIKDNKDYITIPLIQSPDSKTVSADARAVMGNIFFGESNGPVRTINQTEMMAARYRPWYAGVPQQSNRFTWGPWSQTSSFGKAEVRFDNSLHPGAYAGVDNMNSAASAKVQSGGMAAGAMLINESGSVTLSGLPEYKMGSPVQLYNVSGFSDINKPAIGPYITDISLDIGTGGISTTYRMQTQRKFGNTEEIYQDKIREAERSRIEHNKKLADLQKHTRRPDIYSNKPPTK